LGKLSKGEGKGKWGTSIEWVQKAPVFGDEVNDARGVG